MIPYCLGAPRLVSLPLFLPIIVKYQCQLISAAYQYHLISATYQCL
ncbi:unnamed protein product, partial [Staurois parvus]